MPGYSGRMTGKEELELLTRMKSDNDNVNKFTALLEAIPYVWLQTRQKKTNKTKQTNLSSMPGYSETVTGKEELELLTRMKFDNDNVNKFTALLEAIPYVWLQTRQKKKQTNEQSYRQCLVTVEQ